MNITGKTDFEIAKMIDTNLRTMEDFKMHPGIVPLVGSRRKARTILDFGCGLGRNIVGLCRASKAWSVIGFDLPEMIERAGEWIAGQEIDPTQWELASDWSSLASGVISGAGAPLDVIVATLVFQHVAKKELGRYLACLADMAPRMIVHGRRAHDEGGDTWELVSEFFELPGEFPGSGRGDEHRLILCTSRRSPRAAGKGGKP